MFKVYKFQTDNLETYRFADVDMKVCRQMRVMIKAAEAAGNKIIWDKFRNYCLEYFVLPECTIDRCILQIVNDKNIRLRDLDAMQADAEKIKQEVK